MKRSFIYSVCAVIAALGTVSCENVVDINAESQSENDVHEVVFQVSEVLEPESKTTINLDDQSVFITWNNTPASMLHLYEDGKAGSSVTLTPSKNGKTATMSAQFSGWAVASTFSYNAVIASSYQDGIITVPSVQHPVPGSFDPEADVLIGKGSAFFIVGRDPVSLSFARPVAITRLVVSGLEAGEKVETVEICGENPIAGPFEALDNFKFAGYSETGSNSISLNFDSENTVGEDGTFETYFVSWAVKPGTFALNVITDRRLYSKTAPAQQAAALKFNRDALKTVKVDMAGQEIAANRYELVTSEPANWSGTYIVVSSDETGAAKILNASDKSHGYAADVTVQEFAGHKIINATDAIDALSWDISNTGKKSDDKPLWNVMTGSAGILGFIGRDAKYLYNKGGITVSGVNYSGILLTRQYYYHQFAYSDGVQMKCVHGSDVSYLGWTGSAFAYGSNSGSRVYLYKYNDGSREDQVLLFDKESVNWPLIDGKYKVGGTYPGQALSASSKYQEDLLSYESSDPSVATVDSEGNITIKKAGEVVITVTAAASSEYRGASASYQIIIAVPYYQRINNIQELVSGGKYLIVSKSELLGSRYHAFDASASNGSYNYDINPVSISDLWDNPIYDNGNKIKATATLETKQVEIEKDLLSGLARLAGLDGTYTIKPVSVGKYMYCDMGRTSILDTEVAIPSYSISFSDFNLSGLNFSNWMTWFSNITTLPHNIVFAEDGTVSIRSAVSSYSVIGADLYYNKLSKQYSYINMMIIDGVDNIDDLLVVIGQNSEYAWLLNIIKYLGDNITIKDLVSFFAADLYIYRYIG
ncbi:MAG: Ig-like domain-containing protein [Bacteroidales bacterium]|nr:Ig-like domain-containing protein [Bacteroidales bacterium]